MADLNVHVSPLFADGQTVELFDSRGNAAWPGVPPSSPLDSAVVTSGFVAFNDVDAGIYFIAALVSGAWVYKSIGVTSVATGEVLLHGTPIGGTSEVEGSIPDDIRLPANVERTSQKGQINGYADLDGSGQVPVSRLGNAVVQGEAISGTSDVVGTIPDDIRLPGDVERTGNKGVSSGYASLGADGKVPGTQLPTSGSAFKGTYDASTGGAGTPALNDGTGTTGDFYVVSVAGTVDHGAGAIAYTVGDEVIYNGTVWQRVPSSSPVTSVNGYTGAVTLVKADLTLGNVDNTSDANKPVSTAQNTAIVARIPASLVDVKGDLIAASAADTVARLAAGTNGHALFADSAQATGLVWRAIAQGDVASLVTDLGNKQAASAILTTLAGMASDDATTLATLSANVQAILDAADYAAVRLLLDLPVTGDLTRIPKRILGGSETGVIGDAGTEILSGGADRTYTLPTNASVAHAEGTIIRFWHSGTGDFTVAAPVTVGTFQTSISATALTSVKLTGKWAAAEARKLNAGADIWQVRGQITI